jgi:hypothetical protein
MSGSGSRILAGLLGPEREGHPGSRELVAFAEGALGAEARLEIHRHLTGCGECAALLAAARAGLEEIDRLERAGGEAAGALLGPRFHSVAAVPRPAGPRFLAATDGEEAPWPEERRVLLEREEPPLRIVLYRAGSIEQLGLFSADLSRLSGIECSLDEDGAPASSKSGRGVSFSLGPPDALFGRTLHLRLCVDGVFHHLSWTLVEEEGPA